MNARMCSLKKICSALLIIISLGVFWTPQSTKASWHLVDSDTFASPSYGGGTSFRYNLTFDYLTRDNELHLRWGVQTSMWDGEAYLLILDEENYERYWNGQSYIAAVETEWKRSDELKWRVPKYSRTWYLLWEGYVSLYAWWGRFLGSWELYLFREPADLQFTFNYFTRYCALGENITFNIAVKNHGEEHGSATITNSTLPRSLSLSLETTQIDQLPSGSTKKIPVTVHAQESCNPGNYYITLILQKNTKQLDNLTIYIRVGDPTEPTPQPIQYDNLFNIIEGICWAIIASGIGAMYIAILLDRKPSHEKQN